ncbi:unnamed protein product, partial [Staurois parvus]
LGCQYVKKKTNNYRKIKKFKFWPRFMMKYYLFAKCYKKNTFFQNVCTFSLT